MKKLGILAFLIWGASLWGQTHFVYFDSDHYKETGGKGFKRARDLVEMGHDYKAFFVLDQAIQESSSIREKMDALILKGWLAYRYARYSEARQSWQKALSLAGSSHPWLNLWLSFTYLLEGNIVEASKVFEGVTSSRADRSLYLTLDNRLSVLRIPLKEAQTPYLDFVTYLEGTDTGVLIGNLYGGLAFFDALTSKITVLEPARPSMVSDAFHGIIGIGKNLGGYYLAKKSGIYWLPNGGKSEKISLPPSKGKNKPSFVRWMAWGGGLDFVVQFEREGLWFHSFDKKDGGESWKLISQKVHPDTFLTSSERNGSELLYLNEQGNLASILWIAFLMDDEPFITKDKVFKEKLFQPVKISDDEFWLASPAGYLWQVTDQVNLKHQAKKGEAWLAFWQGESGLFSVITESGQWQRIDHTGKIVDEILFPVPILSGLIHHLSVGASYVWINIASEVYGLSEKLLFSEK